jgi:hypothetical protein
MRLEDGELDLEEWHDFSTKREIQKEVELSEGKYILMPLTGGATLTRPKGVKEEKVPYVSEVLNGLGRVPHTYVKSSLQDIFRKADLGLKRCLNKEELNLIGSVMDIELLKNLKEEDFNSQKGRLSFFAADERGLTQNGFIELMTDPEEVPADQLLKGMAKMGYNDEMYSCKSRAYVCSIHSESKIKVKMGDTLHNGFATTAAALFNDA